MTWIEIIWTEGRDGNIHHLAEHRVTRDEVEHVFAKPIERGVSESSGRPIVFGYTAAGRFLAVVYGGLNRCPHGDHQRCFLPNTCGG